MNTRSKYSLAGRGRRHGPKQIGGAKGFTIIEVMFAAAVLALGITTAITTLQSGFQALDNSRNLGMAAQVMQSEFERLRLKNWDQIQALQDGNDTTVQVPTTGGVGNRSFACQRTIRDLKTEMKEIILLCSWRGYDGRSHQVSYITRYGKSGLYDYFYTAH